MTTQLDLVATDRQGVTLGALVPALTGAGDLPLLFSPDGRDLRPGYHVTEVKAGHFAALDCGANPERWTEIFIQLWDPGDAGSPMTAARFAGIIAKVSRQIDLDHAARLTFEVSDGSRPLALYRAALPRVEGGALRIALTPRPASCKPRDRGPQARGPCRPASAARPCCGEAQG